nr:Ig-like domain-containing protein [Gemmatimonadaceae bacterium]
HARTSADDATLMVIARRWVDGRRHAGDARDVRSLVRELLGDRVSQGEVEQVVRRLPVAVRMGPVGMRRAMVGMIGVIAMTVLAAAPSVLRRPPDVELFVLGDSAVHRVAFRAAEWRASDREVLRSTAMTDDRELRALAGASFAESRPTGGWVATRDYAGGSSELDLVLPDGQRQRLTESTSDDLYASAGPDGRIAFLTTRFDPDDHTDVALLDPVTGRVVPLTRTPDWEGSPKWSPDGTRIAFVRRGVEGDPRAPLCTIGVDGAGERCVEPSSGLATRVEAWTADDAVAVTLDRDGVEELAVVDLSSGAVRTVHAGGQQYTVSPDGAWFATSVVLASTMRARWVIGDMRQGEAVREVDLPSSTSVPIWRVARTGERALARVSIDGADRPLAVDVPQRMAVSGTDALGRTVVLHDVRWSVSDTAVATIDGAGMLTPRRAGGVRVRATVGGWRSAEVLLRIAASPRELVVDEQWSAPSRAGWAGVGWRLWGVPRPRVVSGEGGAPALLIDGDGNHHSGAYLDRALDASRGVSMEVRLSLPVSRLQWQTITVGFTALPDSAARATWDHGDARPTAFGAASSRANCEVRLPAAEGALGVGRVVAHVDTRTSPRIAVPATLFDGRWFTVRVSLLPDGRCSMAIDGRVVWTSENAVDRRVPVHAVVHGQSVGTAVKVGRVVVSRGGTTAAGGKELHFR